ncbi:hypothetical protein EmuJ_000968000 [Echinococcus multilocularis]|uniref:Uncharacterized protein n=1 Tax=Echinococcus multilocularis TaxID=6211 RepID=A0A068YI79_ECHMU|nr:hypothetical protein EmuJ_000968000 [Echinococcus multilocularis]
MPFDERMLAITALAICLFFTSASPMVTEKCFSSDKEMIIYLLKKYGLCNENPRDSDCPQLNINKKATLAYFKRSLQSPELSLSDKRASLAYF